jgi:hypothetical protein
MGRLTYEGSVSLEVDDRTLLHLQIVIGNKLKRGEPFHFTWTHDPMEGGGRTSIWIHPGAQLVYTFSSRRRQELNRSWMDALMSSANSASGMYLLREPSES